MNSLGAEANVKIENELEEWERSNEGHEYAVDEKPHLNELRNIQSTAVKTEIGNSGPDEISVANAVYDVEGCPTENKPQRDELHTHPFEAIKIEIEDLGPDEISVANTVYDVEECHDIKEK
ncbi:hypothetical protein PRIPAC_94138 [Pristionchus pacificus]|uniref:Uncharacterized protein n=1 Tax=Pristionchus pacificus TaxID=54126 RepID=A0A2A6BQH5_PRIPA|nr:hypothetical protein PRIPAC_94138 [Pristionchus pacificus]|eukprot:PDM68145.1 hypothetical protein PRIPAC_46189 [Pristionchus pacificus]